MYDPVLPYYSQIPPVWLWKKITTTASMEKFGAQIAPENVFVIRINEAYTDTLRSHWEAIAKQLKFFKPVKLDAMRLLDRECAVLIKSSPK